MVLFHLSSREKFISNQMSYVKLLQDLRLVGHIFNLVHLMGKFHIHKAKLSISNFSLFWLNLFPVYFL